MFIRFRVPIARMVKTRPKKPKMQQGTLQASLKNLKHSIKN